MLNGFRYFTLIHWPLLIVLICLSAISACSSSSDKPPADNDPEPNPVSVITVDNHVELLKYVFDIFTGQKYGSEMLSLPGYPDPAYNDNTITPNSVIETATCINGGTVTFTPFLLSEYYSGGDRDGWNFNFENCQKDTTVFDGVTIRESLGDGAWLYVTSTRLETSSQTLVTRFSGELDYKPGVVSGGGQFFHYTVNDVSFSATENSEPFELSDASFKFGITGYWYKSLNGQFFIKSMETGEQRLNVQIVEPLEFGRAVDPIIIPGLESDDYFFEVGRLQLTADNGDYLRITPNSDDEAFVDIEISNENGLVSFQESWLIWKENLVFTRDLLD